MSSATVSTESSTDEGDEVAKLFRKALNSRERPRFRRLVPTTGSDRASALSLVEKVPIYRELEEEKRTKWSRALEYVFPPPIYNALKPPSGKDGWIRFIHVHFPIVNWLWTYTPKQLIGDTVSGLTVGVTHIPQGIGFALLASVPPVIGLYTSLVPVLIYTIFGTSRHLSVGTFPVVALMVGDAVNRLSSERDFCGENFTAIDDVGSGNVSSGPCDYSMCNQFSVDIAVTLSFIVGIFMLLMSFLKLGVITVLLSDALISGYTTAAAFSIVVTQMQFLFGLNSMDAQVSQGYFITPRRFIRYCELIFTGHVNLTAMGVSTVCIVLLLVMEFVNKILKKKVMLLPIHIPAQLIVVVLATSVTYAADLSGRTNLTVVADQGGIPPGKCFKPTLPSFDIFGDLVTDAIIIAIISFVINIAQAKLLAKKNAYTVSADQELFAYGSMNLGGSFFGSFPAAGALSRTVLQDATGGHTQLVGLISSTIVLFTILLLGFLFSPLPNAAVAAIVIMALKGLLLQVRDVRKYYLLHLPDMTVWLVVFLATLVIALDVGLGIGVIYSLLLVLLRTILPFSPGLGEAHDWVYPRDKRNKNLDDYNEEDLHVKKVPNVYIYQFNAPLYFANVGVFSSRLFLECGLDPHQFDRPRVGCFKRCYDRLLSDRQDGPQGSSSSRPALTRFQRSFSPHEILENEEDDIVKEHDKFNFSKSGDTGDAKALGDLKSPGLTLDEDGELKVEVSEQTFPTRPRTEALTMKSLIDLSQPRATDYYHTLVIDCGPISFVDSMGVATIEQTVAEFDAVNIQVLLAAPSTPLCKALSRYGFFNRYSYERIFPTVASAVKYATMGHKVPIVEEPERMTKKLATGLERQFMYHSRPSLFEMKSKEPKPGTQIYRIPEGRESVV